MRKLLLLLVCLISPAIAQTLPGGIGQGYDGELKHVTSQLMDLAEATPTDKFAWRPSPGVRSTSEVYMHIAVANLYYVSVVGKQIMPAEIKPGFEKSVTAKADVISWLKRSLDAARDARAHGAACRLCPHDRRNPAVVERLGLPEPAVGEKSRLHSSSRKKGEGKAHACVKPVNNNYR